MSRSLFHLLPALCLAPFAAAAINVAFTVTEPSGVARTQWPVTSGIPFAQGALRDPTRLSLHRDANNSPALPLQTDVLARWPDGSVRWLLVDFQTDLAARQAQRFILRDTPTQAAAPGPSLAALRVTRDESTSTFVIDTGPLRLTLHGDRFDPFGEAFVDRNADGRFSADERVTRASGGFFVRDPSGARFESAHLPPRSSSKNSARSASASASPAATAQRTAPG